MDLEAKGFLTDHTETVAKDAALSVQNDYSDLPPKMKVLLATERAEGKLDGMYTMFMIMNEKERDDDAREAIASMLEDEYALFLQAFDVDPSDL